VLKSLQRRIESDRETERRTDSGRGPDAERRSVVATPLFRLGRAIFGGILALLAIDNLRNLDERIEYARAKDAPAPDLSVPGISIVLLLGSIGVTLWRLPSASAAAVAAFFAAVTPQMHDFWTIEDDQERQQEFFQFLKNGALFGAAIALARLARRRK